MKNTIRGTRLTLSAFALMAMVGCAAIEGQESGGQYVDDATISTKVRAAFVNDPVVKATQVHVETMQGVVELSGFVNNKNSENRAVSLARQVEGVKQVRDEIVVR